MLSLPGGAPRPGATPSASAEASASENKQIAMAERVTARCNHNVPRCTSPRSAHSTTYDSSVTAGAWLDTMSPWPLAGFGVERMRALLAELGDPQGAFPAIHVVGTNGKSTATVTIEQLLLSEGLSVGSTI